ncbi:DUF1330 domain-containing protein [Altererythrobacter litoralis]|uniref:DUF1330 domain-containing protein n=1 Tax=Altererythrobacter litoralis TaxID=3113904 RepID=A0ABU7GHS6_9SPHN|nr:DUF1330 domain-containing protein [Erythrobacteraceae bacterium 1XM1-14]
MSAYLVACYDITDEEGYAPYPTAVAPTLVPYDGELIVADFASERFEGEPRKVTVIVKFPSKGAARSWYASPEYQRVLPLRRDHSEGEAVIVNEWVTG